MSLDGFFIHHLTEELKSALVGGRINKIYQLSELELLFHIRANYKTYKLIVSSSISSSHVNITLKQYENQDAPFNFCMLIRKHFEGAFITNISQVENDRILIFDFSCGNELGDMVNKKMICEIMGRNSNIIFTNEDYTILDAIRRLPPSLEGMRTILPRATYVFPHLDKRVSPFHVPSNEIDLTSLQGVSSLFLNEVRHTQDIKALISKSINPVVMKTSTKEFFYCFPLEHIGGMITHFNTLSELLDYVYEEKDIEARLTQQHKELDKFLNNELQKNKYKLEKLKSELEAAVSNQELQKMGELLSANLYKIKKGDAFVIVEDYYDQMNEITIPLNENKTPSENLKLIFTKLKKSKNAIAHIEKQILLTLQEIDYFEEFVVQFEYATPKDLEEMKQELETNHYLRKKRETKPKKSYPKYETYQDETGTLIFLGKNNIQNDYLTHTVASRNEYWFHVQGGPGSHVVVKSEAIPPENTLRAAANLAAYYSKFRNSSSVPVDYTQIKNLKKIPGQKGSKVIITGHRTIFIDPSLDSINKLKKK